MRISNSEMQSRIFDCCLNVHAASVALMHMQITMFSRLM